MTRDLPRTGRVLVTGPSNAGKTRLTAAALDRWVAERGPRGVVVLEFAPELERDGRLLGGRLSRFTTLPDGAWRGVLEANAPRAEGSTVEEERELARDNAERAARLLAAAPTPRAAFVNDATIPFQHPAGDVEAFLDALEPAELVVSNAYAGDGLGRDDPVTRREAATLERLRAWATEERRLVRDGE